MNKDKCLYEACFNGSLDIVKFFFSLENEDNKKKQYDLLLTIACERGYTQIVQYLIEEEGVDLNSNQNKYNWTPLHIAARYGSMQLANYLLGKGPNTELTDYLNMTPAEVAQMYRHMDVFKLITTSVQKKN